jgi:hypothetical protein
MEKNKETSYFGEEKSKKIINDFFDEDEIANMKYTWETDDAEKDKENKNLKGDEDINMPQQFQKDSINDSDNILIPDAPKCIFCGGDLDKNYYCPVCDFKFKKDDLFAPITPNNFIFSELKSDEDVIVITPILYWRKKKKLLNKAFKVPDTIFLNCGLNPTAYEPSKFSKLQIMFELPTEEYIKFMEERGFIWDKSFNKYVNKL